MPPFSKAYICCIRNIHPEFPPLPPLYVPSGSVVKNLPASRGDTGLIPRKRRSPGEGNGNPLQYSCLENPKNREAWQTTVHGVAKKSDIT